MQIWDKSHTALSSTAALISRQVCSFLLLITVLNPPALTSRYGYLGAKGWLVGPLGQHSHKATEKEIKGFIFLLAQQECGKPVVTLSVISLGGDCACWVCFVLDQLEEVLCLGALPPPFHHPLALGTLLAWLCGLLYPVATRYCDTFPTAFAGRGPGPPQSSSGLLQFDPLCSSDPEWGIPWPSLHPENPFTPSCIGNGLGCPLTRDLLGAPHISTQPTGEENSSLLC